MNFSPTLLLGWGNNMSDQSILDLASLDYAGPSRRHGTSTERQRHRIIMGAGGLAMVLVGASALMIGNVFSPRSVANAAAIRVPFEGLNAIEAMAVDDRSQLIAEGDAAKLRNAALPGAKLATEPAAAFSMLRFSGAEPTALRCLTQAVYYEAAVEPMQGRRAVAQVVLNRVRHPAYPKSVCGVVYQGSERRTGCQFSFTCDGSLLRGPSTRPWVEAEAVAKAALAGYVEPSVGTATHYHADYVLPRWAFELDKIEQLGRHIFYRFDGAWGRAKAFSGRYSGLERIPALDVSRLRSRMLTSETIDTGIVTPGLTVTPHVTDRHAQADVGGRIDVTKEWRPSIPDPVTTSSRYRELVNDTVQNPAADVAPVSE